MSDEDPSAEGPRLAWLGVLFALALVAMSAWVVLEWTGSMPPG